MSRFEQFELNREDEQKEKDKFSQLELPPEPSRNGNITPIPGGSVVSDGNFASPNYVKGQKGWKLDSEGNADITGGISTGALDIGGSDATSFHVDTAGNMWLGDATFAAAPAKISNAGAATFANATITGGTISGSMTIGTGNLNIAARGWTQTCAFSVTDADTVAWAAGSFISADGTTYAISAGNTGNMVARTFIYLDTNISTTVYQTTTTAATAVGAGKVLLATALNGTGEATFETFGGVGGTNLNASSLVANSITANELSTSLLYAGSMQLDVSGNVRSGQTDYNTGTGFWLGNSGGTPKFSIGTSTGNRLTWDGTSLTVIGTTNNIQSFTSSGTWTKPAGGAIAFIQCWGAGGSGGKGSAADEAGGGGGGGSYTERWMAVSSLGATETVTVGAGGASVTVANTNGNPGGTTSFGSWLLAYGGGGGGKGGATAFGGGGGGGGVLSAGSTPSSNAAGGAGGRINGGAGATTSTAAGDGDSGGAGGGFRAATGTVGGDAINGGAGGGGAATNPLNSSGNGGLSLYGGGGGGAGGQSTLVGSGGTSYNGGAGGAGGYDANNATAGTIPAGGGGGSESGNSGAGANGKIIVTVF